MKKTSLFIRALLIGSLFFQLQPLLPAQTFVANTSNEEGANTQAAKPWLNVNGVFPHMTIRAPGLGSDSEAGTGALVPWADRLWVIGYVSHKSGEGIGLYEVAPDMTFKKHPASEVLTGTYANRYVHWASGQAFIGPYAIDSTGDVRVIEQLKEHRLTATMSHLTEPNGRVYFLTMEGLLFDVDVENLEVRRLFDLVEELEITSGQPHFKAGFTGQGRVIVANNTYEEAEFLGRRDAGRLAEWDGGEAWRIIEKTAFIEVAGKQDPGRASRYDNPVFAVGWDRRSVILMALCDGEWETYRMPFGSRSWNHTWNTEWMRIREAQTERYLMDAFGIFYDLPLQVYDGKIWGVRPVGAHMRIIPDFCYWNGMLVLGGNQTDRATGQPQSGLWFGNIDDLTQFGKPTGWGAVWWDTPLNAGDVSDRFLMTGFDKKVMHISSESDSYVTFTVEVDFLGDGSWVEYKKVNVPPNGYRHHEFPDAFSAHWIRLRVDTDCVVSVQFMYN